MPDFVRHGVGAQRPARPVDLTLPPPRANGRRCPACKATAVSFSGDSVPALVFSKLKVLSLRCEACEAFHYGLAWCRVSATPKQLMYVALFTGWVALMLWWLMA